VESCCNFGDETSGSMKCWETIGLTTGGLSISAQLQSYSVTTKVLKCEVYEAWNRAMGNACRTFAGKIKKQGN
jgi:hypothetical protein